MKLLNESKKNTVIEKVEIADTMLTRLVGLLAHRSLDQSEGMWIKPCNSIHTFFMRFPIDCVFVDKDFVVKAVYREVKPYRLLPPIWGARSVFELSSGVAELKGIEVGDKLNVAT